MPYPFVPGETLGAAELNAALDMRMMSDGTGLAFTPGAVLFGATTGKFQTDAANLFYDDTNNRLGVRTNAPQVMFQVGKTAATARTYNSYTDAANGEFAYLGDWGGTANVVRYGSGANGTGLARDVSFVHGDVEQLGLASDGVYAGDMYVASISALYGTEPGYWFRDPVPPNRWWGLYSNSSLARMGRITTLGSVLDIMYWDWDTGSTAVLFDLVFGWPRSTSIPALKANGANLEVRLGNDSAPGDLILGKICVGGTGVAPNAPFDMSGTFTSSVASAFYMDTTLVSYGPVQAAVVFYPTISPSVAGTAVTGVDMETVISGSVGIAEITAAYITGYFNSYTGPNPPNYYSLYVDGAYGLTATKYASFHCNVRVGEISNGAGVTTGIIHNRGLQVDGVSSAPAVGGTMYNTSGLFMVPAGSGAGTTTNFGVWIGGNGGSGGGGSTTNWALYSDGTAHSALFGGLRIGVASPNPTNATGPFLYITGCNGVPTGAPTYRTSGAVAITYDQTTKKIMVYDPITNTWKGVAVA